ncbi:MAG TPA: hypothetical protein VHF06_10950 [Pseudonocardiaceae bacterium]|nr:hypothetical protein [Pseudonocardiaceae bacterium]
MTKLDITTLTRGADDLLLTTENPLHRQILLNYRRHALLEVSGLWQQIFVPAMTVDHPVYYLDANDTSETLDGLDQVSAFYTALTDSGTNVIVVRDEQIAVADWGFGSESWFNTYARGSALPGMDPDKFYLVRQLISMHWPYDDQARLIGEHVYEHAKLREITEIPESDFITPQEARQALAPLIRPLPPFPG